MCIQSLNVYWEPAPGWVLSFSSPQSTLAERGQESLPDPWRPEWERAVGEAAWASFHLLYLPYLLALSFPHLSKSRNNRIAKRTEWVHICKVFSKCLAHGEHCIRDVSCWDSLPDEAGASLSWSLAYSRSFPRDPGSLVTLPRLLQHLSQTPFLFSVMVLGDRFHHLSDNRKTVNHGFLPWIPTAVIWQFQRQANTHCAFSYQPWVPNPESGLALPSWPNVDSAQLQQCWAPH